MPDTLLRRFLILMARAEGDDLKVLTKTEDKRDTKRGFERRLDGGQEPIEPA